MPLISLLIFVSPWQHNTAVLKMQWEPVQYFDNKIICDLIEEKHKGIISILVGIASAAKHPRLTLISFFLFLSVTVC